MLLLVLPVTLREGPFTVTGDLAPAELEHYAVGTVRWARERLKRQYFPLDPQPLTVYLFRDAASYRSNVRALTGTEPVTPFGFYSPEHGGLFMNIGTGTGTLVHELVHPYLEANFPHCPPWFNEGLASLYEQCEDREGLIWGLPNWRLPVLVEALRAGRCGSFERLMGLSAAEFYGADRAVNYAQARYLCLYLQDRHLLEPFYQALLQHPEGTVAWRGFGVTFAQWQAWVLSL